MGSNRVVVTGMGVVSPNALGVADFHNALLEGRSGVKFIEESKTLNFRCHIAAQPQVTDEYKAIWFDEYYQKKLENKGIIYACLAGFEAWEDAGLTPNNDEVDLDSGMVIGSGALGLDSFNYTTLVRISAGENRRLGSRIIPESMSSGGAAYLNKILGLGNRIISNSSACITGSEAILMGYEHLKLGKAKRMLCGSTEGDGKFIWGGFDAMRVLCSDSNDNPEYGSRPMSATSAGFVAGSGSGMLVLETLECAQDRGAKIYAEILGGEDNSGGLRNGGTMTAPNPQGVIACIQKAMEFADITGNEIDLINGHLTSTKGDPMEISNWKQALHLNGDDFPLINTPKSMIGHCIAGAGSVELIASLLQLTHGFVHRNLNLDDIHPEIEIEIPTEKIPTTTIHKEIDTIIKANFGFGDLNCALILRKWK